MILLEVVNARIAHIEVLYREDIRELLRTRIP
jgi:hypothetical protein